MRLATQSNILFSTREYRYQLVFRDIDLGITKVTETPYMLVLSAYKSLRK